MVAALASMPAMNTLTPNSPWNSGSSHAVTGIAHSTSRGYFEGGRDASASERGGPYGRGGRV